MPDDSGRAARRLAEPEGSQRLSGHAGGRERDRYVMQEWWHDAGAVGDAQAAIAVVSGKWVIAILRALIRGPLRHNELHRAVGSGIRPQVLDDTLRRLEAAGIVVRRVRPGTPPAVSYELSAPGRSLWVPLA
ncbi:MAG: helix-turn-helix transcriptional regulator, partial [Actinomycetota bacterium]|nr:helix-turn-helix transcriptional regulator [Actinomycetota bacterium]